MKPKTSPVPQNPPAVEAENLSSATECTGLTPAAILSESEAAAYAQLYHLPTLKKND